MENVDNEIRYEENAVLLTSAAGWACKTCGKFYGLGNGAEHLASWCCANSLPCSCGGRIYNKMYTCCDKCLARKEKERWEKKELKEWDGETPIYSHAIDKYFFFDFEEIEDVAYEENLTLEEMKLVLCQPARKPVFDIANILNDYLVEDYDPDDIPEINKVEKTVQNWIDEHVPTMWEPSKYRVDLTKMEK